MPKRTSRKHRSRSQRHVGACLGRGARACEGKKGKAFDRCMSKFDKRCM